MTSDAFGLRNLTNTFDKVYVDSRSLGSPLALRIQDLFLPSQLEIVSEEPFSQSRGELSAQDFDRSKKNIFITPFQGQFFKRCPGASQKRALTCCNYFVLNLGSQCNMNCSYCYLQSYLNSPIMKMYSNIDQALLELKQMGDEHADLPFRIGTGEVIDSLSLDSITMFSKTLIEFFANYPKWKLEFKTKSASVDQFLDVPHAKNVVVSWSINPPFVIDSEEHGTASFQERLLAARKCADSSFPIAFHIDPMIYHSAWKENYAFLVDEIHRHFTPDEVQVISIGALRFQPEQRHIMRQRFGMKSLVMQAEMHPSEGGKLRYDSSLRGEMFQFVFKRFKNLNSKWNLFFCMETPETWISAAEKMPMQLPELKDLFRPLPSVRPLES